MAGLALPFDDVSRSLGANDYAVPSVQRTGRGHGDGRPSAVEPATATAPALSPVGPGGRSLTAGTRIGLSLLTAEQVRASSRSAPAPAPPPVALGADSSLPSRPCYGHTTGFHYREEGVYYDDDLDEDDLDDDDLDDDDGDEVEGEKEEEDEEEESVLINALVESVFASAGIRTVDGAFPPVDAAIADEALWLDNALTAAADASRARLGVLVRAAGCHRARGQRGPRT